MPVTTPTEIPMSRPAHDRFERVIAEHYESLKPEVLATVRGKLAVDSLHPDPSDLEAAYNAAWHALYERSRERDEEVGNLGGWLATITYRRAIDDVRRARLKYRAPVAVDESFRQVGYEHDVDSDIADRQRYHQWLMSVRLRLNAREQQAVSLCVLHEHSRRDASDIMGIDIKRLDKIMVAANKKLGGLLEAINRGEWCQDQRSLIKAYALGLHEEGGERHELAVAHVMECQACAAYVRSLRGLAVVVPAPALLASAVGAGGGIVGGLSGLFGGGAARRSAVPAPPPEEAGQRCWAASARRPRRCASALCVLPAEQRSSSRARPMPTPPADSASASRPTPRTAAAKTVTPNHSRRPALARQPRRASPRSAGRPTRRARARRRSPSSASSRRPRRVAADEPSSRGLGAARSLRLRVRHRPLTSILVQVRRFTPADPCERRADRERPATGVLLPPR